MFGKLRDSWVVWRRKVGEKLNVYGDKLDTYNPVAKTEDMSTPVGVDSDGKLWTSGGGGGGGINAPHISFDVVADTPYTLSEDEAITFATYCLTADFYIGTERFYFDTVRAVNQNTIYEYYSEDYEKSIIFTANSTFTTISATSSITGTVIIYLYANRNISLHAIYENDQIIITEPYSAIDKAIEEPNNGALIVHITGGGDVTAIGYLTITRIYASGTPTFNISCDIDIDGKFNYEVDGNGYIVGTKNPK